MSEPISAPTTVRPSSTIEDYLAIIFVMERDGETAVAARLAESLEVTPPMVATTLRRMERDGWITIDEHKGLHLTEAGREAARSVMRRHLLVEWMLARMLHIPWSRIHAEAHQIEHTISPEIEASLQANLADPQLCPHGNPLPGYESVTSSWIPLTQMSAGERAIVRRVHERAEDNQALMRFLETNAVIPGIEIEVTDNLPFNQTLQLELKGSSITLGFSAAQHILVDRVL